MLYDRFCCVWISMIYMNRAIPAAWYVPEHGSSAIAVSVILAFYSLLSESNKIF